MERIYLDELDLIDGMETELERFTHLNSTFRSIFQSCALTSLEIVKKSIESSDLFADFENIISRFHQPSDGLPLEVLEKAVPIVRSLICKEFLHGWFEGFERNDEPLIKEACRWVEFRNATCHGVPDQNDIHEWEGRLKALTRKSLKVFKDALPRYCHERGELRLSELYSGMVISTPLVSNQKAQVLKRVNFKKGIWKLQVEQLCWENSADLVMELGEQNLFSDQSAERQSKFNYSSIYCDGGMRGVLQNIPSRQTSTFEGRKKELDRLATWFNEPEESKSCLIYGDGGYGKTTLVLEFLNRVLDGHIEVKARPPEIISYHTAKMTKWTDQGITHFRGISSAMGESLRELMYCFYDVLGKEWYALDGTRLLSKVQTVLADQGYKRDDILLVLDNTETLTSSTSDTEELTEFLEQVERKIGRIILTSRRREGMGSRLIKVSELEEKESISLMVRLAREYGAKPILQAGEPKLRKASSQLMHKPLLIDALVKYIARASVGIDEALHNILRKTNDQLLEFLYEDAWLRMSEGQRDVFLVLVLITCPADEFSVGYACQEVGIPHDEFILGLEETYFANQTKRGNKYEIDIVELARDFFVHKFSRLTPDERKAQIMSYAESVDDFAREKAEIEREYKSDRVAEAFKGTFAKAAKVAAEKGRISEAREHYELAIQDDPLNSALHDRFAWFLLHRAHDTNGALEMAKKSVELDPRNADALLTLGITHYRRHELEDGDIFMNRANKAGKPEYLCLLRMGIGRYHTAKSATSDSKVALTLLDHAVEYLKRAQRLLSPSEKYFSRNTKDIERYIALSQNLTHDLKSGRQGLSLKLASVLVG